jgi:crotonobetainyl-CoA:carnitine CoA-transferase CaiB-like acyl-CoA transferase
MRSRTTADWIVAFVEARVPAGPLLFPEEVFDDAQIAANDYLVTLDHHALGPYQTAAAPVRMSATPLPPLRTAPLFGEHSAEILTSIGYSDVETQALIDAGVVAARES